MTKAFPTSTLNSEPDRDDEVVKRFQRVHYWPKCEVPTGPDNVCCLGQTRHTADITKPTRLTQSRHPEFRDRFPSGSTDRVWRERLGMKVVGVTSN